MLCSCAELRFQRARLRALQLPRHRRPPLRSRLRTCTRCGSSAAACWSACKAGKQRCQSWSGELPLRLTETPRRRLRQVCGRGTACKRTNPVLCAGSSASGRRSRGRRSGRGESSRGSRRSSPARLLRSSCTLRRGSASSRKTTGTMMLEYEHLASNFWVACCPCAPWHPCRSHIFFYNPRCAEDWRSYSLNYTGTGCCNGRGKAFEVMIGCSPDRC